MRFLGCGGGRRGVFLREGLCRRGVGEGALYGNGGDGVAAERVFCCGGALAPGAGGRIVAEGKEAEGHEDDEDAWHNEGDAPCFVAGNVLIMHERVVHCWHDEVGYAAAEVAQATCEGVGSACCGMSVSVVL